MKNNPYVGPRPFEQKEREYFFGRNREARDLFSLILAERVVLFYAQSGAGKTSLLNARVIPALRNKGFDVLRAVRVSSDPPPGIDREKVDNIFVLSVLMGLASVDTPAEELLEHTLLSYLRKIYPDTENGVDRQPPILIVDQFEEIFSTHRERWQDVQGFFAQVSDALQAMPTLGVVFAVREDYVAGLDPYASYFPKGFQARFRMERLGPEGALAAVARPALKAGCPFDPGVAERLVDNLRQTKVQRHTGEETILGPYVEPVQLQVVCSRLWDNLPEQEDNAIQWEEVERYGNIDRALTDFYESALKVAMREPGVSERDLRRWFGKRLITPVGTRGLALRGPNETEGLPNAAVDVLVGQHIIRADVRAGARWYELAHDRLVEPILEANQAWDAARETALRAAARRWQETGDASLLYLGKTLAQALQWAEGNTDELEPYETEFLDASQQFEQARIRRRRLYAVGTVVGLLVLVAMTFLSFFAITGRQEAVAERDKAAAAQATAVAESTISAREQARAEEAQVTAEAAQTESERQASLATSRLLLSNMDHGYELNLLYAAEAINVTSASGAPTLLEANDALRTALASAPLTVTHWGETISGDVFEIDFSPDGTRAMTSSGRGNTARLWDSNTGKVISDLVPELPEGSEFGGYSGAFDASGTRLIIWNSERAYLWNAITGEKIVDFHHQPRDHTEPDTMYAGFSSHRSMIATYTPSSMQVRVWDANTGESLMTVDAGAPNIRFSPDERFLATIEVDEGGNEQVRIWNIHTEESISAGSFPDIDELRFSPDSRWLACHDIRDYFDAIVQLVNVDTGDPFPFPDPQDRFKALAFRPDSLQFATAENEGLARDSALIRLWNVSALTETHSILFNDFFRRMSYDGTGTRLAVSGASQSILVDVTSSEVLTVPGTGERFSPNGVYFATQKVLLDASTGKTVTTFDEDLNSFSFSFSPDSSRLLVAKDWGSAGFTTLVDVLDTATGESILEESSLLDQQLFSPQFSADGQLFRADRYVFDAISGELVRTVEGGVRVGGVILGTSPNGDRIVTWEYGGVAWWDLRPYGPEPAVISENLQVGTGPRLTFSPDRRFLMLDGDPTAAWDMVTGDKVFESAGFDSAITASPADDGIYVLREITGDENNHLLRDVAANSILATINKTEALYLLFSPDGRWAYTSEQFETTEGNANVRRVLDAVTGNDVWLPEEHLQNNIGWTSTGPLLATVDENHNVRVWDLVEEKELSTLQHNAQVRQMIFSPDGSSLFTIDKNDTLSFWDVYEGKKVSAMPEWNAQSWRSFTPGPDGTRFAAASDHYVADARLWDATAGSEVGPLRVSGFWLDFLFSPTGDRLLISTHDGRVLVNAYTSKRVVTLERGTRSVDFDSDGDLIAIASFSTVGVREAGDGRLIANLPHESSVEAVAFSPDDKLLATITSEGVLRVWQIEESALIETACRIAGRNMDFDEWNRYLADQPYRLTCPQWPINPRVYSGAKSLARAGDLDGARAWFLRIAELDPDLTKPEALQAVNQARAEGLVQDGSLLATQGDIVRAIAAYEEAQEIHPSIQIESSDWIDLCYEGALQGYAEELMNACNQAVILDESTSSDYWLYRAHEGRGMVLAQLGRYNEAVDDFQVVLGSGYLSEESDIELRQQWIEQLGQNRNPFDEATLEALGK